MGKPGAPHQPPPWRWADRLCVPALPPQAGWRQIRAPSFPRDSSERIIGCAARVLCLDQAAPLLPLLGPWDALTAKQGIGNTMQRKTRGHQRGLNNACLMAYEMNFPPGHPCSRARRYPQPCHSSRGVFCCPLSFREPSIQKSNIENVIHSPVVYLNGTNGWSLKISCHFFTI